MSDVYRLGNQCLWGVGKTPICIIYRTLAIITCGFYYFPVFSHVSFSLMFGNIPLKLDGYKTRVVITRARLILARVRYIQSTYHIKYFISNIDDLYA